jgi:hypothetical protein
MNYVTREKVLEGVAEVKEGIVFCLSLPLDYPGGNALNPRRSPPRLAATQRAGKANFCYALANEDPLLTDVVCDDQVLLTLQYSTQWDSLAHVGGRFDADGDGKPEMVFYNGYRAGDHVKAGAEKADAEPWARFEGSSAGPLGIENLAEHGAQGRGVLVDLHAHFGRERKAIGYDDLMRVLEKDEVAVEKGDFVCFYTGFADVILELNRNPDPKLLHGTCTGLEGRDDKLLKWITDCGLRGADRRQLRRGDHPRKPVQAAAARAHAAARALPVQERHPSRRALVPERARKLAARAQEEPLPAHRAAAQASRGRRLAGGRGGHRLVKEGPWPTTTGATSSRR